MQQFASQLLDADAVAALRGLRRVWARTGSCCSPSTVRPRTAAAALAAAYRPGPAAPICRLPRQADRSPDVSDQADIPRVSLARYDLPGEPRAFAHLYEGPSANA